MKFYISSSAYMSLFFRIYYIQITSDILKSINVVYEGKENYKFLRLKNMKWYLLKLRHRNGVTIFFIWYQLHLRVLSLYYMCENVSSGRRSFCISSCQFLVFTVKLNTYTSTSHKEQISLSSFTGNPLASIFCLNVIYKISLNTICTYRSTVYNLSHVKAQKKIIIILHVGRYNNINPSITTVFLGRINYRLWGPQRII